MERIPFEPEHLDLIEFQRHQQFVMDVANAQEIGAVLMACESYSYIHEGVCYALAGLMVPVPWRAMAWTLLSKDAGKFMLYLTRNIRQFLDEQPYQRIELISYASFKPSMRWAEMLGFRIEGLMEKYFPTGEDGLMYARIKHG